MLVEIQSFSICEIRALRCPITFQDATSYTFASLLAIQKP